MKQIYSNLKNREAVTVYYIGNFLGDLTVSLHFAIYAVFLAQSGLNLLQVNTINFVYMISIFLLEVPTGAFADALGRRRSILIGAFLTFVGLIMYPIFRSFYYFMIAEFILALSSTFTSGAWDAWMIDTSKNQGFVGKVDYVFSQSNIISKIAMIFGGLIGAYIASIYIGLPFFVGGIIAFLGFVFLLIYMEEENPKIDFSIKRNIIKIKNIAYDAAKYSLGHKVILWLIIGGIVSTLVYQPLNMFWNIRFNDMLGQDKIWILGWLWAAMSVFMILGSYAVKFFLKRGKDYTFLMILVSLGIFFPILLSAYSNIFIFAFPPFLIYQIFRGIARPVDQAYINKYATQEKRATIISFESMMSCLGAAGGLLFFGWIAKSTSIEVSWIMSAVLALALIPIYLIARKNEAHYA
jgi:MFS family permease